MKTALIYLIQQIYIYIYLVHNIFMVSWQGTYSYFNNEQNQIGDIESITAVYGSSGSFGSRVRSKYIGHNTYTGRRSNICSKPAPIHGPLHKYDLNCLYLISHFSCLPQAISKQIIFFSKKVSYASKIIYPVINGFNPHEVTIHLHICDNSVVTIGIRGLCLGFSNTSHVYSLYMFRKSVNAKVKTEICKK